MPRGRPLSRRRLRRSTHRSSWRCFTNEECGNREGVDFGRPLRSSVELVLPPVLTCVAAKSDRPGRGLSDLPDKLDDVLSASAALAFVPHVLASSGQALLKEAFTIPTHEVIARGAVTQPASPALRLREKVDFGARILVNGSRISCVP